MWQFALEEFVGGLQGILEIDFEDDRDFLTDFCNNSMPVSKLACWGGRGWKKLESYKY